MSEVVSARNWKYKSTSTQKKWKHINDFGEAVEALTLNATDIIKDDSFTKRRNRNHLFHEESYEGESKLEVGSRVWQKSSYTFKELNGFNLLDACTEDLPQDAISATLQNKDLAQVKKDDLVR